MLYVCIYAHTYTHSISYYVHDADATKRYKEAASSFCPPGSNSVVLKIVLILVAIAVAGKECRYRQSDLCLLSITSLPLSLNPKPLFLYHLSSSITPAPNPCSYLSLYPCSYLFLTHCRGIPLFNASITCTNTHTKSAHMDNSAGVIGYLGTTTSAQGYCTAMGQRIGLVRSPDQTSIYGNSNMANSLLPRAGVGP